MSEKTLPEQLRHCVWDMGSTARNMTPKGDTMIATYVYREAHRLMREAADEIERLAKQNEEA